jgi:hypothetical protein
MHLPFPRVRRRTMTVRRLSFSSALWLGMTALSAPILRAQAPPAPAPPQPTNSPAQPTPNTPAALMNAPEFRKGVLLGRVLDITGKPVPDATVALQDKNGKVLAWAKTNAQGDYAIAADPLTALQLRPSRRRGLLEQIVRAAGDVVTAPVKVVGSAVANPGKTVKAVAVSAATGTPAPLAVEAASPLVGGKTAAEETAQKAREAAAKTAVGDNSAPPPNKPSVEKGQALIVVSASNFKEAKGKAGAYWLEAACTEKDKQLGMQAWLETVKLAPMMGEQASEIVQESLTLEEPHLEPTLVSSGGTVKLRVKLKFPVGLAEKVRVFARETHKDVVVELLPQQEDKTLYTGTMTLDPKTPVGETTLTIAALRADPVEVKLNRKKADPLGEFVRRLDDMEAKKPYEYDPRIMASENRLDIKLTVLDAKKGTPAVPAATPQPEKKAGQH